MGIHDGKSPEEIEQWRERNRGYAQAHRAKTKGQQPRDTTDDGEGADVGSSDELPPTPTAPPQEGGRRTMEPDERAQIKSELKAELTQEQQAGQLQADLATVRGELEEWQSGKKFHAFSEELHTSHPQSKQALDTYVEVRVQDAIAKLPRDTVKKMAKQHGLWPPKPIKVPDVTGIN